jgi:hypothetical protein
MKYKYVAGTHFWAGGLALPLMKVGLAAVASFILLSSFHVLRPLPVLPGGLVALVTWFALGVLYTHLFEYGYHRVLMHRGLPFLGFVKASHLQHHRTFAVHFTSRDHRDLDYVVTQWPVFPILFYAHYLLFSPVIEPENRLVFFAGVSCHYILFEATHWFTHLADNAFDRVLARVPLLNLVRARQIQHHLEHHEQPDRSFNFNPPYLGDLVAAAFGRRRGR